MNAKDKQRIETLVSALEKALDLARDFALTASPYRYDTQEYKLMVIKRHNLQKKFEALKAEIEGEGEL